MTHEIIFSLREKMLVNENKEKDKRNDWRILSILNDKNKEKKAFEHHN